MADESASDDPDQGRPVVPEVRGNMAESKGVWRILLNNVGLAAIGIGFAYEF